MRVFATIAAVAVLTGCAGTNYRRVTNDAVDGGIRYYESAPFLLISSDGKGGVTSEIKFLPDTTKKRSINPFAVLAQNESTLTFDHGVLTQGKTVVDETVVPKAIVTALEKVVSAAMAAANAPGDEPDEVDVPLPRLFKIVITATDVSLVGGQTFGADGKTEVRTIRAAIADPSSSATPPAKGGGDASAKPDKSEDKK